MKKINLNGKWQLYGEYEGGTISSTATVPGCVHTDLMGSVLDYDIFYRDNADKCQWIENSDWKYERHFDIDEPDKRSTLVLEGVDVYASVYINGELVGECDDMFFTYNFKINKYIKKGDNVITVLFKSPVSYVKDKPALTGMFTTERLHTRRIQCTYGWDWVGRFVTCGIYKDVYITVGDDLFVDNFYIYTKSISNGIAQLGFSAKIENSRKGEILTLEILSPQNRSVYKKDFFVKEKHFSECIDIESPQLWYPAEYGGQPLYTVKFGGIEQKFGIREVNVYQIKDKEGSPNYEKALWLKQSDFGKLYDKNKEFSGFELYINGIKIMCKGANWVPCEPFPSAESDEKITKILSMSAKANVNMIRVWGGGIFEKQHFYNECDRLGILVTQDFLMACGNYPEYESDFIKKIKEEAKHAAISLRNHPSLVWWSGDNENAFYGSEDMEKYNGREVVHKSIMPVLNKYDPNRRFFKSSPYGGNMFCSRTVGTTHNTQVMGYMFDYIESGDMTDYKDFFKDFLARFIAEEPVMGAVSLSSLRKFMTDDDIYSESPMWLYHTKGNPAMKKELFWFTEEFARRLLGEFKDGKDRFFKLKYLGYEWLRISMENVRRNTDFCSGIIYWMLNDCWPAASGWALIDYYSSPKPMYYSFKRSAAKTICSIDKEKDSYNVYLCNDSLNDINLSIKVSYLLDDVIKVIAQNEVTVKGGKSTVVYSLDTDKMPYDAILIAEIENGDRAFYKNGALELSETEKPEILKITDKNITLKASSYIHAVELDGDCEFSDNYFSMLPNEIREVSYDNLSGGITVCAYTFNK